MKRILGGFANFSCFVLVCLIAAPIISNSAVLTRCQHPGYCFATYEARADWAASHNCQFDQGASSHDTLPPLAQDCSKKNRADQGFLQKNEGKLVLKGYVPKYTRNTSDHKAGDVIGASGVTVSTGIDLGQQSESGTKKILSNYINQYGNADSVDIDTLINKLHPYFSKQKEAAVAALESQPLEVTDSEASLLEKAFGYNVQVGIAKQFDAKNSEGMVFQRLPMEAQTVIIDFVYQYGLSETRGPVRQKFWEFAYKGDWNGLSEWLSSPPDVYRNRRVAEGDLLKAALDSGALPKSGNPCENVQDTNEGEPIPDFVPPIILLGEEGAFLDA